MCFDACNKKYLLRNMFICFGCLLYLFITVSDNEKCKKVYCRNGNMCFPKENGKPLCFCPKVCNKNPNIICSVYREEFTNPCELHRYACSIQTNIAIKQKGRCSGI